MKYDDVDVGWRESIVVNIYREMQFVVIPAEN